MNVDEIRNTLQLQVACGEKGLNREVRGGYCGDLLSDVMANSGQGALWLTIQSHQNVVAVAVLKEHAAIILVNGRTPDDDTRAKADEEGIPVLLSSLSAYALSGLLHGIGVGRAAG